MQTSRFEIDASDTHTTWAELEDGQVMIRRTPRPPIGEDELLLQWDTDTLHNLLSWATREGAVSAYFSGPMAQKVRDHSKELGMTPEMFVWHAVKVFTEVGASS